MKNIVITGGSGFIGRHLVEALLKQQNPILNLDLVRPDNENHHSCWKYCDIRNLEVLQTEIGAFQPDIIIHLAAETETNLPSIEEYSTNIVGTKNLLDVCKSTPSLKRIIITSTQHVRKPGSGVAKNDEDYVPYKNYGASKVITEKLTRGANLSCTWTIIRPTTIWGPHHVGLSNGFWKVLKKGLYFHPSNDPVIRSYGYVENVVYQIRKLLEAAPEQVNEKTLYVGDENDRQFVWVNEFSRQMIGKEVRQIPKSLIFLLALFGDFLKLGKINFPMDISRYKNLTITNPVPISKTFDILGPSPITLEQGIQTTIRWFNSQISE